MLLEAVLDSPCRIVSFFLDPTKVWTTLVLLFQFNLFIHLHNQVTQHLTSHNSHRIITIPLIFSSSIPFV